MKKLVSTLALVAFLFSMNVNAQEDPKQKKTTKTEKACTTAEKKACATEKKGGCCAAKKAEPKV
ncbi:hypothetical protein [Flavobacterium sp. GT3R68]|uniref:hypothetical protein n=1 Tax=Flavobacterium sp. GT3R68 TaxID=2594437 RepID=UPI000F8730D6|nr:hypothetical protein [Flavobacterium sp. GT3R68]RTY95141.1 hypothetical protein EKL32_06825 [Flavobacterium sp. GSN2]TRW91117.1 hypothetical protein FNW07_09840 [Flavobacterium sp. GT3R68]